MEFTLLPVFAVLLLSTFSCSNCMIGGTTNTEVCLRVPFSVDKCYAAALKHPISPTSAKIDCLQRLMWYYEPDQNLTAQDLMYFSSLSQSGFSMGVPLPKTGFRIRKEYRLLTDMERQRLNTAFVKLYEKGIIKKYADMHRQAAATAHKGAAYLAWHRVFLAMFEDELRLEDKTLSLPYLDVTLDEAMDNGVNSIIWSSKFLGNANGDVVTGPFAGWRTARGKLWRDYGNSPLGRLTSEKNIKHILSRCKTNDIVFPLTNPANEGLLKFIIEYYNSGVQNWVGGDMSDGAIAPYDPVFYMVTAFADLQWEMFRVKQKTICGVNPETDYAVQTGGLGHGPNDIMHGFDGFRNIDGHKSYWTQKWYNYDKRPKCPHCGSKYLYCDVIKNRCVSHSRRTDYNVGQYLENPWATHFGITTEPFEPKTELIPKRILNKFYPSPLTDGRTRESAKYDAKKAVVGQKPVPSAFEIHKPVQKQNLHPPNTNSLPYVLHTAAPNIKPAPHIPHTNVSPLNLNININKHSLPALLLQQPGHAQPQPNSIPKPPPVQNKPPAKPAPPKPKVIDLFHRMTQHTQQMNQNANKGLNNHHKPTKAPNNRRKYISFV